MLNLIFWIGLAIGLGVILFTQLQEKLPDELDFLRSHPTAADTAAPAASAA